MPGKGLPQTTMNALAAQEQEQKQNKNTPMGDLVPDPVHAALMTGDLESLPDSGGPMGTSYPPSGSTIGPAPSGWFERMRQNGFQITDEVRGYLGEIVRAFGLGSVRSALPPSYEAKATQDRDLQSMGLQRPDPAPNETGPWPRIIR